MWLHSNVRKMTHSIWQSLGCWLWLDRCIVYTREDCVIQAFDIQTMLFMDILIGFSLSIALGFCSRDQLVCPGFRLWLFSLTTSTLGLMFLWLRWCIPLWLSVGLGNGLLLLSYVLLWLGFRQYTRSSTKYDK